MFNESYRLLGELIKEVKDDSEVVSLLSGWLENTHPLKPKAVQRLMQLLRSGENKYVVPPASGTMIYRGLQVNSRWLHKLGIEPRVKDDGTGSGIITKNFMNGAPGKATSWSTSRAAAMRYFGYMLNSSEFNVLMIANTAENPNLVAGPSGFYRHPDLRRQARDREVIALGPVKVSQLIWRAGD